MTRSEFIDLRIRYTDNLLAQRRVVKQKQALCAPLDEELDALLTEGEEIQRQLDAGACLKLVTA